MKAFISYASEQQALAQEIALALRAEGHDVFLDRSALPEGEAYNARIRDAVRECDLFVFLISPESVVAGRYTQTEIKFAEEQWPSPGRHVLPVMVKPTSMETIPPYLRAVSILQPRGNAAAEVVAAVARRSRSWPAQAFRRYGLAIVALAVIGGGFAASRAYQRWRECGEAARLVQQASLQRNAGDYAGSWDGYGAALARCPADEEAVRLRERLAGDWLDNIRVTEGKGTFTEIVDKVQPVLSRAAASTDNKRAANALAHLGWGDFLKSREGHQDLDPTRYYQQAVERDRTNPFAHAMWGHYILTGRGNADEATAHFQEALATTEERPFVRELQFAGYLWRRNPDLHDEIIGVANGMRKSGESLPPGTPNDSMTWPIWNVYYERLITDRDRTAFLTALSPEDHLATFRWLFPEKGLPDDKRHLYLSMLAQLQEHAGDRARALATYQSLLKLLGTAEGRVMDDTREAVRRLTRR